MKDTTAAKLMIATLLFVATTVNAPHAWAVRTMDGAQDEVLLNLVSNMIDQNKPEIIDSQEIPAEQKKAGKVIYELVQNKQPLTAEAVKQIDQLCPDRPMLWFGLGMLFVMKGSQASAIKALEQSLKLNPDLEVASRVLQQLKGGGEKKLPATTGQSDDLPTVNLNAIAEQEKVDSDDRIELALCSLVRGDADATQNEENVLAKDKAKYLVLKSLVTKPWGHAGIVEAHKVLKDDDWLLWTVIGNLALQGKDLAAAEEYYKAAFQINPRVSSSAGAVSRCLRAEGKTKEADQFDRQNKPSYGYPPE